MIAGLRKSGKKLVIGLSAMVLVAGAAIVGLEVTEPYAVYADGTKVDEPYVLKAGDDELLLVEDQETAEKIIEAVVDEYSPAGAQINSIVVDKKLTVEEKALERGEEPPEVMTQEDAINYVLEENKSEEPLFSVVINAETGTLEKVKAGKSYKKTDKLYKGESEVGSKGVSGNRIVTNSVTSVNGAVLTSEVVDTAVVKEAEATVIFKGNKDRPKDTAWADYSGKVVGSGDGAAIANFALQFVGNPYVYGGTSLTNGADCSGFVQSVFGKFGISLPRTAYPQARCGKGVSLSEAKAGDIVLYSGHIAIYIGNGKVVHAYNSRRGICVTSVHDCGAILAVKRIVE